MHPSSCNLLRRLAILYFRFDIGRLQEDMAADSDGWDQPLGNPVAERTRGLVEHSRCFINGKQHRLSHGIPTLLVGTVKASDLTSEGLSDCTLIATLAESQRLTA